MTNVIWSEEEYRSRVQPFIEEITTCLGEQNYRIETGIDHVSIFENDRKLGDVYIDAHNIAVYDKGFLETAETLRRKFSETRGANFGICEVGLEK